MRSALLILYVLAMRNLGNADPAAAGDELQTQFSPQETELRIMSFDEIVGAVIAHDKWLRSGGSFYLLAPRVFLDADLRRVDWVSVIDAAEKKLGRLPSLDKSNFAGADLTGGTLLNLNKRLSWQGASFVGANLTRTAFSSVDFQKTNFSGTTLSQAGFFDCDFTDANFSGDLTATAFVQSSVRNITYEPKPGTIPDFESLRASELKTFQFSESAAGLVQLRNAFKQNGLRDEERAVTYAIERTRVRHAWDNEQRIEASFRYLLFELPSGWGLYPERCLTIPALGIFIFTVPYFLAICCRRWMKRAGIWAARLEEPVHRVDRGTRAVPVCLRVSLGGKKFAFVVELFRALGTAFYFSVLSAFRIGFREVNVGSWITRMQPREFTLRATGWVRMVAGFQSLLSVYLVALWLLTYFGRPFE
jgi:hypothetical protein